MPDEPTQPTPARRPRADQDQAMANRVTVHLETLTLARDDAEIAALLSPRGYAASKLEEGFGKQRAAQSSITARQQAIGAQKDATAKLATADDRARKAYADFRETARSVFQDDATRAALGLNGKISPDTQKFITATRASYDAALANASQLAGLAPYGYAQTAIEAARATLDALIAANNAQDSAIAAATRATQQRDAAVSALDAWLRQFRGIAKVALRARPDLQKKLGV